MLKIDFQIYTRYTVNVHILNTFVCIAWRQNVNKDKLQEDCVMKLKRILAGSICAMMLLASLTGCGAPAASSTAAGGSAVYEGQADGRNGVVKVEVEFDGEKILGVKVVEHQETEGLADPAISDIPAAIVEQQSIAVDSIGGCTITSDAIKAAVKDALTKAGADMSGEGEAASKPVEADVEETVDVVVVGSGGAGLSAAIEAAKTGAKVTVVEKMSVVGGNTLICGGGYNAIDPERQGAMGIEDSVDLFVEQTLKGGDNEGDPELVRVMCEGAMAGAEFLEEYGMVWQDEISTAPGGLYQRRHMPGNGKLGIPMINALKNGCEQTGVTIMLNTRANEIIMEDGKAAGVICEGETGNKVTLHATKGVVLATGGFGANVEMRQEYNTLWPTLDESVLSTNHPGATGDGITMAKAVGADLVDMQFIQLFAYGDPTNGAMTGSIMRQPENAVYLNLEGERFVNEYERRDVVSAAVLEQTNAQMYVVVDGKTYENDQAPTDFSESIAEEIEAGRCVRGDTIEELAENMGMDPAVVKATIDEYNAGVDANNDKFGKTPMNKIDTAPFYGNLRTPVVHHTMGGIRINTDAQVISTEGEPIPGLFAAGETTGDIHGTNRVGANALPDIIVFGRIAGQNAAK